MGLVDIVLRRKSVYALRKAYDRLREKADKEPDMNRKMMLLHSLDQIEPTLVALEEQMLSGFERRRMIKYVNESLGKTKKILKDKEYFSDMMQQGQAKR
jgi:hypothetical protein